MSTSSHQNPKQPSLSIVGGGTSQVAADHDDAHRPVELHRQTAHKLEVWRRYPPVFAAITAKGFSKHVFLNDTHGGGGIHATYGSHDGIVAPGADALVTWELPRMHSALSS